MSREDGTHDEPPFAFEDVWPDDKPFPLSDAECARLVRGHLVRWRGTLEEALELPGMYEMMDGWLYVRGPDVGLRGSRDGCYGSHAIRNNGLPNRPMPSG